MSTGSYRSEGNLGLQAGEEPRWIEGRGTNPVPTASHPDLQVRVVPSRLNFFILGVSSCLNAGLLWGCSHSHSIWIQLVYAWAFSYSNNTLFGLVHESVHRSWNRSRWVNDLGGVLASVWHPTGLVFQRICHFGHHLRNRTDHEIFDMYYEKDNRVLKFLQFYGILTGVYWMTLVLGCLIYLLFPSVFRISQWKSPWAKSADFAMLEPFVNHPEQLRIRLELGFSLLFQCTLFYFLDLKFLPWLLCYWSYGMNWGSLQYADHAWSIRDIREGAWNLKVLPWTRWIYLNYHFHLVHHRFPSLSWVDLPRYVSPKEEMPQFWKIYFKMWKGPTPVTSSAPQELSPELRKDLQ